MSESKVSGGGTGNIVAFPSGSGGQPLSRSRQAHPSSLGPSTEPYIHAGLDNDEFLARVRVRLIVDSAFFYKKDILTEAEFISAVEGYLGVTR